MDGLKKPRKRLSLPGSQSGLKKIALKRLPRKEASLRRFLKGTGISPSQVETCPNITSVFPNRRSVLEALRFSQEPAAIAFLQVYDDAPSFDRNSIPFEAIALKSKANIAELLGAMMLSFQSYQAQKSAALVMDEHPGLVAASVKFAKKSRGIQDRKMLHEAVRFLPTPKGQSFNFNFGKPEDEKEDSGEATTPEVNELFPMITDRQEKWQADRSRMLEGEN
jgi:hypothetical protein